MNHQRRWQLCEMRSYFDSNANRCVRKSSIEASQLPRYKSSQLVISTFPNTVFNCSQQHNNSIQLDFLYTDKKYTNLFVLIWSWNLTFEITYCFYFTNSHVLEWKRSFLRSSYLSLFVFAYFFHTTHLYSFDKPERSVLKPKENAFHGWYLHLCTYSTVKFSFSAHFGKNGMYTFSAVDVAIQYLVYYISRCIWSAFGAFSSQ